MFVSLNLIKLDASSDYWPASLEDMELDQPDAGSGMYILDLWTITFKKCISIFLTGFVWLLI